MKFDPGKAWPYPVLRPKNYGDDYPQAEFEVEIDIQRAKNSTAVEVSAEFQLSDPSLLQLVKQSAAQFALLLKASRTHYRQMLESNKPHIKHSFAAGELSGRVEFAPFLICTKALGGFQAGGWHADFAGRSFNIHAGAVLAVDEPKDYWIDTADEAPIGSIFGHKPRADLSDGRWELEFQEDHVWIVMSNSNAAKYEMARKQANNRAEGQYLMNGLYLPALLAVLQEVDQNLEQYQNCRWFASLDQRLESVGCQVLGSKGSNRWVDAQKVLDSPFPRMPIIAEAEIDES